MSAAGRRYKQLGVARKGTRYWRAMSAERFAHLSATVLTPRQVEAIQLIRSGLGLRLAAVSLGISNPSVDDRLASAERRMILAASGRTPRSAAKVTG